MLETPDQHWEGESCEWWECSEGMKQDYPPPHTQNKVSVVFIPHGTNLQTFHITSLQSSLYS